MVEKVFIYTISTKEDPNNIRYIGKTIDIKDRTNRHLSEYYLNENTYKSNWLKHEIKSGNTPILLIIDEVSHTEWQFWESYWIDQLKSWGFKLTNGTKGGEGVNATKETINKRNTTRIINTELKFQDDFTKYKIKMEDNLWVGEKNCDNCSNIVFYKNKNRAKLLSIIRRSVSENRKCLSCRNNSFYGKKHTKETLNLIKSKSKSKKIIQLDLENNIIHQYDSIRDAERSTGISRRHISGCCNKESKHNTAGGFVWKFT